MALSTAEPDSQDSTTSRQEHNPHGSSRKRIVHDYRETEFSKRNQFLQTLNREEQCILQAEEERIKQLREGFKRSKQKTLLLENVRSSFVEWRNGRMDKLKQDDKNIVPISESDKKKLAAIQGFLKQPLHDLYKTPFKAENETNRVIEPLDEFKAGVMHFEKTCDKKDCQAWKGTTAKHKYYSANFPDQKITMENLLNGKSHNPLKREEDVLKYIHIPANHMEWVQKVVERYYEEDKPGVPKEKTNRLLSREYWRGQLHGSGLGKTVVHARHMRPRCSHITQDTGLMTQKKEDSSLHLSASGQSINNIKTPPNFAIFLPYLHWETNRRRKKLAEVVQEVTQSKSHGFIKILELKEKNKKNTTVHRKFDRLKIQSKLGRYLYDIAQACETMNCDADERLIRHGLSQRKDQSETPLHIRRTLDQFYFLTLADTSRRDTDQVVYRQTRTRIENDQGEKDPPNEPEEPQAHRKNCRLLYPLRYSGKKLEKQPEYNCAREDSSKAENKPKTSTRLEGNTRVVMVDQLWMWILDENTIITSFPRRWGANKHDSSGVHKSLREKLAKTQEIRSVYHLAILIIDQCSRVFFDRTQPTDDRPEVMDLFAQAIGTVTDNTTSAYELFWNNVKLQSLGVGDEGERKLARRYLNINPEGVLLREAQDIAEELLIMAQIFKQQQNVMKDFKKYMDSHRAEFDHEPQSGGKITPDNKVREGIRKADIREADDSIEKITNRTIEINELEGAVRRTTQQLQELLTLKQQQASIVEARAALDRANETVKQGRSIMAFTVVTILFAPLGFLAGVFGMNNSNSTNNAWMTLKEQIMYMVVVSAVVVLISLSLAFVNRRDLRRLFLAVNNSRLNTFMWLHYKMFGGKNGSRSSVAINHDMKPGQTESQIQTEVIESKAVDESSNEQTDTTGGSSYTDDGGRTGSIFGGFFRRCKKVGDPERE